MSATTTRNSCCTPINSRETPEREERESKKTKRQQRKTFSLGIRQTLVATASHYHSPPKTNRPQRCCHTHLLSASSSSFQQQKKHLKMDATRKRFHHLQRRAPKHDLSIIFFFFFFPIAKNTSRWTRQEEGSTTFNEDEQTRHRPNPRFPPNASNQVQRRRRQ